MLAYRHGFHAGNHADVLKHMVLVQLMRHMALKDKGYRIVDTHAGAGQYALDSPQALKNAEHLQGIARLWNSSGELPPCAADYLQQVRRLNPDGRLRLYPGSPMLVQGLMRTQDQLRLFELHPAEARALQDLLGGTSGVELRRADGFDALKSQLPPPTRRALLLIDPSYEGHADYRRVLESVGDALRRFAQSVCMVWYPRVAKPGAAGLLRGLKTLAPRGWLHASLDLQPPDALGFGLTGSGVFVINPPHTLYAQLQGALPWLVSTLQQHAGAGHVLEQRAA
jgi:23S rRNA (adenine2030-N6)-methyltransferase